MDKLKRYNQLILAISGTIALLLLLGTGIFALSELWGYNSRMHDYSYDTSIVSEDVTDSLASTQQVRTQIISLNEFSSIDSAKAIYVLPIGQKNLDEEEDTDNPLIGLSSSTRHRRKEVRRSYGPNYNNLILFGPHLSNPRVLFDEKVAISFFSSFYMTGKNFFFIKLANTDTNKDGVLNAYDHQKLYLFDLEKASFLDVQARENISFKGVADGLNPRELIFMYGEDRNRNGEFESQYEPTSYYKLNPQTGEMNLLLPIEMLENLQNTLEGDKGQF